MWRGSEYRQCSSEKREEQSEKTHLDSSLDRLNFDRCTLVQSVFLHVYYFTALSINTELMFSSSVFRLRRKGKRISLIEKVAMKVKVRDSLSDSSKP
jgi:hypothetical protein